jgi:hypothetical protein
LTLIFTGITFYCGILFQTNKNWDNQIIYIQQLYTAYIILYTVFYFLYTALYIQHLYTAIEKLYYIQYSVYNKIKFYTALCIL